MNGVYSDFLLTTDWNEFANAYKHKQGNRCEMCGSPESLEVHHLKYSENKMNEDDLIVLCHNCHECMERHINRFKAQVMLSFQMSRETYINLIRKAVLDFYQNSFYKQNTQSTIMGFSQNCELDYRSMRNILELQLQLRFPDIEILYEGWLPSRWIPRLSIDMSGVFEWRNNVIAEALKEGIEPYTIQNRFRISESTFYKVVKSMRR